MAGTFTSTGTISNLTRVELEQLRRADFFSNGKALTIGDSALPPEGVVGRGDVNAEPYLTGPTLKLDDIYSAEIATVPGGGLSTISTVGAIISETTRWYGPTNVFEGTAGYAAGVSTWQDDTVGLNFTLFVQNGDVLLIKPNGGVGDANQYVRATVSSVAVDTLTLSNINNPFGPPTQLSTGGSTPFSYIVVRPNAVQLFAVPGSGPLGREQTFLMVSPSSTLHSNLSPSIDDINTDRIRGIVPASYALDSSVDRSDAVFPGPGAPAANLLSLGYRVILYPDDGTGLAPDLDNPITALNPVIDSTIPATDQRLTIDYKAGIVRFSVAPRLGDDIKVSGGVNPTSGRLSLYAVFWAVDTSLTAGAARQLYSTRSTELTSRTRARVYYDVTEDVWRIGATIDSNEFFVDARSASEDPYIGTRWGTIDTVSPGPDGKRYFAYRSTFSSFRDIYVLGGQGFTFRDQAPNGFDPDLNSEVRVADKQNFSIGDGSAPTLSRGADANPTVGSNRGYRTSLVETSEDTLRAASLLGYGVVHFRKGKYYTNGTINVPPGVLIEGEGPGTAFSAYAQTSDVKNPVFRFGPNTPFGVYDFSYAGAFAPLEFTWSGPLEGIDICWNPTRRVWGIVHADPVTQSIYFNEMSPYGVSLYPGVGVDIKQSADDLFTGSSANAANHTGSHYPRLAHHWQRDEYSIVWCELQSPGGTDGPRVALQVVWVDPDTLTVQRRFSPQIFPAVGNTYSDHPSVAVDNRDPLGSYRIGVSYWSYSSSLASSSVVTAFYNATTGVLINGTSDVLSSFSVVSATDVDDDEAGNFLFVASVRKHYFFVRSASGSTTDGSPILTDAGAGFLTGHITFGSRYHHTTAGTADSGRSGVITAIAATTITVRFDDVPNGEFNVTSGVVDYVITPPIYIRAKLWDAVAGAFGSVQTVAGRSTTSAADYFIREREPDFPRVKFGGGQYLIAYQNFDSNVYLGRATIPNFDNNFDPGFIDQSLGTAASSLITRLHLCTSFVIVDAEGNLIGPALPNGTVAENGAILVYANATANTARSLGGHVLNGPYPNLMSVFSDVIPGNINENRLEMEVSARSYTQWWTFTATPSLIPDVTWSGSDWVITSPTVNRIISDTGNYRESGPPYLADPSFYFGDQAPNAVDGHYLHKTVSIGDEIHFPLIGGGVTRSIVAIHSEHVVQLNATLPVASGTTNILWILVRSTSTWNEPAGLKNPGFRVSPKGEVVIANNFFTMADPLPDRTTAGGPNVIPRSTELLFRDQWGNSTYTGDFLAGTLPRYGATFQSWNDIMPTSRFSADVTFRGVAVGGNKGSGGLNVLFSEQPMVALAWGENCYGCLDRATPGVQSYTGFFRQSFGPWKSGLKDLNLISSGPSKLVSGANLQVLTKEHVLTRHGYTTSGNPYFATDGYRNVFSYVAVPSLPRQYPIGHVSEMSFLLEEEAYRKQISAVYTDAIGRDPIYHRGPPIISLESPRQLLQDPSGPSVSIRGSGIDALDAAAPKVVWNGRRFAAFFVGMHAQTTPAAIVSSVGNNSAWPKTRAVISMAVFPGDENQDNMNEALIGNLATTTGFLTANISTNSSKIVATTMVTCGATTDWEIREACVIDVAYSGKVYCVVWTMGYNVSGIPALGVLGGSSVGYTLFPDLDGTSNLGGSNNPTTVPSYVIETTTNNIDVPILASGATASITAALGGEVTITGLVGIASTAIGQTIVISGASNPLNNGIFVILEVVSPTSVVYYNTFGASPDANNGAISWTIYGSDDLSLKKARFLHPKVIWDGERFFICFQAINDTLGTSDYFKTMLAITVDEQGPGNHTQHQKAIAANAWLDGATSSIKPGQAKFGNATWIGRIFADGISGGILTRGPLIDPETPYSNIQVVPGDIIEITGLLPDPGSYPGVTASVDTKYAGKYVVVDYLATVAGALIDVNAKFDTGVNGFYVYGSVYSGGLGTNTLEAPDGTVPAGLNTRAWVLQNPWIADVINPPGNYQTISQAAFITRLWGLAFNEQTQEYVVLAECQVTSLIATRRLRLFAIKRATMDIRYEVDIPMTVGVDTKPASLAWNGSNYLVVYSVGFSSATQSLRGVVVSSNLTVVSDQEIITYTDMIGNSGRTMPGPGYDTIDTSLGSVPRLNSLHARWNDKLNRWVVAVSFVTDWDSAFSTYTGHYNEVTIAARSSVSILSWIGRAIILSGATNLRQPGQRLVLSRERTIGATRTADSYTSSTLLGTQMVTILNDASENFGTQGVVPGDVVFFTGSVLTKPRRIIASNNGNLHLAGEVKDPTTGLNITTAVTYRVEAHGSQHILSSTTPNTWTISTLTVPAGGFLAAGVVPGMELWVNTSAGYIVATGLQRVQIITVTDTVLSFSPSLGGTPTADTFWTIRKQDAIFANLKSDVSTSLIGVDVDQAQLDDASLFSTDISQWNVVSLPREDIFLLSLTQGSSAVEIEDADSVYLENVDIGGWSDISERYYNLSRPVWRQGGVVFGQSLLGRVNSRAPSDQLYMTPVGKVETLRLSNVRSKTRVQYGQPKVFRNGKS